MEAAIFESLLLPPSALPLLDDVIFARNFLISKCFGKNFFHISQDKTALLLSPQKHNIEPNYIIVFSGLSSQESAYGRSQEYGFGAALKRKVQSHGRYSSADANFSERSPRSLK